MIEMLIGTVLMLIAAAIGVLLFLIVINILLFFRLRSRIPQKPLSDSGRVTNTHKHGMTGGEKSTRA